MKDIQSVNYLYPPTDKLVSYIESLMQKNRRVAEKDMDFLFWSNSNVVFLHTHS